MSDNTTLPSVSSPGDTIRTDDVGTSKIPVAKLATGGAGIDGGVVTDQNPLPVSDRKLLRTLDRIAALLEEGNEMLSAIANRSR